MEKSKIIKALRQHGLPFSEAKTLADSITAQEFTDAAVARKNDWAYVLSPLTRQIRVLQSSKHRWGTDPHRAKVYAAYLEQLITIKKRINQVKALNLAGESIPEIAAKIQLPFSGMRWQSWVKPKEKAATLQAFITLYEQTLDPTKSGRRLIPFSTREQRVKEDARWDALSIKVAAELHGRQRMGMEEEQKPLLAALRHAQYVINTRDKGDVAPYAGKWEQLLPAEMRDALGKWYADTLNGLDLSQAAAHAREQQTIKAQEQEKRDTHRHAKQLEYATAHRRAKGMVERKKNEAAA